MTSAVAAAVADDPVLPGRIRAGARGLSILLLAVAALVFLMVVVGGITRLTESGLSITEWKPISGAIPPLSQADWAREFALYQATPQYREVAGPAGMTLSGFKFIFFWEWVHRLLGRILGLVFFGGVAWFAARRAIPRGFTWRLVALFVLGGLQGAVGWFMVVSGLEGAHTEVSPYRLSAHLLFALFLFSALIWTALDLRAVAFARRPSRITGWTILALAALFIQLMLGAWVAGFRAGYVSNTWPAMNGHFVPEGIDWSRGAGFALTHDPFLLHFMHRWWAWVVVVVLVLFARQVKRAEGGRAASIAIHSAFGTQVILGILTVLSGIALWLAVLHQANGALLVAATVWGAHAFGGRDGAIA
ncbi:COX15/CtaA family protein [Sphingomonas sp.]|uniref:COX15/CtaA family protein n=1 Tax=Sphingomonas sp. TaxID=28214 RepID=UPI0025CD5E40|nr:COX15/CtaA family protein [Sphingomonas sp.]MBV9527357.1 COX15/CtaA family protein [Sphingomonas sp.]